MTLFFYILIGIITFIAFLHAWSRKDYELSRTVVINRPKAEVYAYIRQLKKQSSWMPWFLNDPQFVIKYKGEDGKLGAASYWKGNNRVEGIQKITKLHEGKLLETELLFLRPYKSLTLNYMAVKELEPDRTKMVWGVKGVHRFPASVFMWLYGMERAIGKDFETGLQNLKQILEKK
ncbi:Polyketide cyclase / dehydrase and lipid transport [Salinimicrobium catena]|uniref:Polyketide cyclase / dehydrase and lipid transport n=1 Tax=Salinimicrobium catena TaxID=390640 RepID=A0A1H5P3J7_9FLAO|nr:SRPBCC family protein [Salinimicrobium catena]SDL67018.1 Polyketide cyclase / dehydrase and lipid transport [Salinimicrobium catena]SEF08439.1 Polyketide cyclase / dehydrase and lipid transport [Salinimicrobium catena]